MSNKKISVTLIKSIGLGLRKMHQTRVISDTPENRGMINKISYLLKVEEVR